MVKYGVPTVEASWAMAAGVATRQAAIVLGGLYASTPESDVRGFRRWLADLDPDELSEEYGISESVFAEASRAIVRSARSVALSGLDEGRPLLPMVTSVRAFRRAEVFARRLQSGAVIELRRDYDSPFRNSIRVVSDGQTLGYVHRGDAQALGPELDAGMSVEARVVDIGFEVDDRTVISLAINEHEPEQVAV
jgi:hypothetical protein